MQKIAVGDLDTKLKANRARLLSAVSALTDEQREQPNIIGKLSVHEWLGYLCRWEEAVGFGLREMQRRKKPTQLLRTIDKRERFITESAELNRNKPWSELVLDLDDARIHIEERLKPFNDKDLNELKRHRWLGNKTLAPFLLEHIVDHEFKGVVAIEAYVKRLEVLNDSSA